MGDTDAHQTLMAVVLGAVQSGDVAWVVTAGASESILEPVTFKLKSAGRVAFYSRNGVGGDFSRTQANIGGTRRKPAQPLCEGDTQIFAQQCDCP